MPADDIRPYVLGRSRAKISTLGLFALAALSVGLAQCSGPGGSGNTVPKPTSSTTATPLPSPSGSASPSPSGSASASASPRASGSPSSAPSGTPSASASPSPTPTTRPSPTPSPSPSPSPAQEVYVTTLGTNCSNSILTVYPANPSGTLNETPLATILASNTTGLCDPYGVAIDRSGKIYVANNGVNSLTVYAANPMGTLNQAPLATIAGQNTGLNIPTGIAVDASGNIYVANPGNAAGGGSVTVYAANPSGTLNEAPLATISGGSTGVASPKGVAVAADGKIYVANAFFNPPSVTVYAANPSGTVNGAPLATITGASTGLYFPNAIAFDASGNIYVANPLGGSFIGSITVYAANPSGTLNEAPLATIVGASTGLNVPTGIAVDASGKIYVTNSGNGSGTSITVYAANPSGTLNEAPIATITGNATGLIGPVGIAIH